MRPIIEFCSNNMHHGTDGLMAKLEGRMELDVIEYGCLGNCGICYMKPFALFNGQIVEADTVQELEQRLEAMIAESEDVFADFDIPGE
ncbi:YuzB family protein [Paenibacillus sp. y28]|uniref:YuzB family protein n=1 Tax=Paenibacillus sp. y28 TaxID=3129110 RepID=UPI003017D1B7